MVLPQLYTADNLNPAFTSSMRIVSPAFTDNTQPVFVLISCSTGAKLPAVV